VMLSFSNMKLINIHLINVVNSVLGNSKSIESFILIFLDMLSKI
jgi:hypothetical protein